MLTQTIKCTIVIMLIVGGPFIYHLYGTVHGLDQVYDAHCFMDATAGPGLPPEDAVLACARKAQQGAHDAAQSATALRKDLSSLETMGLIR